MKTISDKLSRNSDDQVSINANIDLDLIIEYLLSNKQVIQSYLENIDKDEIKHLWKYFFEKKTFNFPIHKGQELFIKNNINNKNKIFNYINFRYLFYLCGFKKIDIGFPPYLLIEPVSSCNLRCPFCFQTDKSFTRKPFMGIMDYNFFKKIVDEADMLGVGAITIASRGEPTLHKDLKEMLKYLGTKKNIFEIKLNSNGTHLTEELCHAIFENKISQVVISADHYEKENFEKLRKNSNFEKIVSNVDMLFEIRKQYKDSITEIRVSGVDFYKKLDQNKFYKFWIKRSDHVTSGAALERWDTYNNTEHLNINDPCENLWDRMYVWFDGKVNPCDADYKSYLSYGNLKDSSLKDIWNNEEIKKLRLDHLNNNRKNINPCNKCGVTFIR